MATKNSIKKPRGKNTHVSVDRDTLRQFKFITGFLEKTMGKQLEELMAAWMDSAKKDYGIVLPPIKKR